MKQNFTLLLMLLLFVGLSAKAQTTYLSVSTTLDPSVNYGELQWSSSATITVNAGDVINVRKLSGQGPLIVNGTLTTTDDANIGGSITVNGSLTIATTLVTRSDVTVTNGGLIKASDFKPSNNTATTPITIKDGGKISCDNAAITGGYMNVDAGGILDVTTILDFSRPNNTIKGKVVAGAITINNGPFILECPAYISTFNLLYVADPNSISGSGYIEAFAIESNNALTASSAIILNAPLNFANPGAATLGNKNDACNGTLPVTLSDFQATKQNESVNITWLTQSETNSKGFQIQVSSDGVTFNNLTFVASKAIDGNSTQPITYNYTDNQNFVGTRFYRIVSYDLDGTITGFTKTRNISNSLSTSVKLYPNPVSSYINISGVQNAKVRVMDISGKVVTTGNAPKVNVSNLSKGLYFVQVSVNSKWQTIGKVVKK